MRLDENDKTTKTVWDAEMLGQTTLNDFRTKYQNSISAERLIEIIKTIHPAIEGLSEAERISGLVGAIMYELL